MEQGHSRGLFDRIFMMRKARAGRENPISKSTEVPQGISEMKIGSDGV